MTEIPRIIKGTINSITLNVSPGEDQIIWDDSDNIVTDFASFPLKIQAAGELVYAGLSLDELTGKGTDEFADYAIKFRVMGTDDLQLDLRTHRQDENNFIALKVDFITDTIDLVETVGGMETTLDQASHNFKFLGRTKYDFELWRLNRFLYGFVNGFNIVTGSTTSFRTEPGLSILFPTFNSNDPPMIYTIVANEVEAFPDTVSLENDPGGLLLEHRLSIKQQIENPSERTWETYVKAVKFYERRRDVGMPNEVWEQLGYPIKKPSSEEWFGNLS